MRKDKNLCSKIRRHGGTAVNALCCCMTKEALLLHICTTTTLSEIEGTEGKTTFVRFSPLCRYPFVVPPPPMHHRDALIWFAQKYISLFIIFRANNEIFCSKNSIQNVYSAQPYSNPRTSKETKPISLLV